jgi:hypothetical protein
MSTQPAYRDLMGGQAGDSTDDTAADAGEQAAS